MSIYSQVSSNKTKTYIIMFLFVIFIVTLAYVFGQAMGDVLLYVALALILSGVMTLSSYYFSDSIILSMSHAKRIEKKDNPRLYNVVENLSIGAGLPMPKLYVIDDTAPNAFATGRDPKHAVVCVTTGLLLKLSKVELEGVL